MKKEQNEIINMEIDSHTSQVAAVRSASEVVAMVQVAQIVGRDDAKIMDHIKRDCKRIEFAQLAEYSYPKGSGTVQGATTHLIERIASLYGHIDSGFRVLGMPSKNSDGKESVMVHAYAWDMHNNRRKERQFEVVLELEKGKRTSSLKSSRDKYNKISNDATRRERTLIQKLLPPHMISIAIDKCRQTMANGDGSEQVDMISEIVSKFKAMGVSEDLLKTRIKGALVDMDQEEFVKMCKMYNSIKDGHTEPGEWFPSLRQAKASDDLNSVNNALSIKPVEEVKTESKDLNGPPDDLDKVDE